MKKFPAIIFIIVIFLLSSCNSNPQPQVAEIGRETITFDEVIHINNCGNAAESVQTVSRSFSTNFEGAITGKVNYQVVEGSISAKYGEVRSTVKSQTMTAAPDTNMEFILRWSEDIRAGNVTVGGEKINYTVRIPLAVEQISTRDLLCNPASDASPLDEYGLFDDFQGADLQAEKWQTNNPQEICAVKPENGSLNFFCPNQSAEDLTASLQPFSNFGEVTGVSTVETVEQGGGEFKLVTTWKCSTDNSERAYHLAVGSNAIRALEFFPQNGWERYNVLGRVEILPASKHEIRIERNHDTVEFFVDGKRLELENQPALSPCFVIQEWGFDFYVWQGDQTLAGNLEDVRIRVR